jgi:hypothetical protein
MGYCCTPFRIDFTRLDGVRGSRDKALLERVDEHLSQFIPDEMMPPLHVRLIGRVYAGEDPHPYVAKMRVLDAAWHIMKGARLRPWRGAEYAEALNAICWLLGTLMANAEVAPAAIQHFNAVDDVLRERGLADQVSMLQLIFGGAPLDLPPAEDFPSVGHLTPRAVHDAHRSLSTQDWSTAPDEVRPTLERLSSWVADASASREGIVCFYA